MINREMLSDAWEPWKARLNVEEGFQAAESKKYQCLLSNNLQALNPCSTSPQPLTPPPTWFYSIVWFLERSLLFHSHQDAKQNSCRIAFGKQFYLK